MQNSKPLYFDFTGRPQALVAELADHKENRNANQFR
jgi:hypothetical protein